MKYRINYDGEYEDSLIIEGDSIEELMLMARSETKKRGWDDSDCWSEKLGD